MSDNTKVLGVMDKDTAILVSKLLPIVVRLGMQAYDALANEQDVPDLDELKTITQKLRELPDLPEA